jgi:p21-activated kinase 2
MQKKKMKLRGKKRKKEKEKELDDDMEVGVPFAVQHRVHVSMDEGGLTGLPKEWQSLLQANNITNSELVANEEACLQVLDFFEKNLLGKTLTPSVPPPTPNNSNNNSDEQNNIDDNNNSDSSAEKDGLQQQSDGQNAKESEQQFLDSMAAMADAPAPAAASSSSSAAASDKADSVRNVPDQLDGSYSWISEEDPRQVFVDLEKCGEGSSGTVYSGTYAASGKKVAVKVVSIDENSHSLENEVKMMATSRHRCIVDYIGSWKQGDKLWVAMEFMDGGSLTDVIQVCKMTEPQIAAVCKETLRALQAVHRLKRIHRDVKRYVASAN